jgi:hypothetical protein
MLKNKPANVTNAQISAHTFYTVQADGKVVAGYRDLTMAEIYATRISQVHGVDAIANQQPEYVAAHVNEWIEINWR